MQKLSFAKVFWIWFAVDLAMMFLNGMTVKSPLLASSVHATIGVYLLLRPVYPQAFRRHWDDRTSKRLIRVIAAAQIVFSFLIRVNF